MLARMSRALGLAAALVLLPGVPTHADKPDPKLYAALRWRHLGPIGNRVIAVVGEPGNPNVAYAGAASGGIWKTTDGGTRWEPIFDDQPVSSVSALAIAPSDRNVVWAGTGETFIRSNISIGNGAYKSTDAGKTWQHMGLDKTGRIGRIVIDPRNPDVVFAAALGHAYGPQPERGLFRTTDGGKSWERVLFADENTGCIDVAMDPGNPRILFAGMWQFVIRPWGQDSGGPGSGIFKSTDGGATWKRLTGNGLPTTAMGKIALAVARTNPNRVYALIETTDPGLWRSEDGGEHWRLVSQDHAMIERPHYYTRFAVAPDDENRLYFVSVRFSMSLDGGESLVRDPPRGGGDTHDVWIDPTNPDRMMVGDDGGVNLTTTRGRQWRRVGLPIAQIYHVYTDNRIPYNVYGNRQDGYSYRGPSVSRESGNAISVSQWHAVGGCESGFAIPDPVDDNVVWSGCYDGGLQRFDLRTRQARDVRVWPDAAYGWPPKDLKYRFNWTFPIAISPHDHDTVYVGSQYVHRTTDGGQSWTVISPDLSTNDKGKQVSSGGLVIDNLMVEEACVVFAIAESPLEKGVIWAGTADGLLHVTRDGGGHWTNVTANVPGLPPWGAVSNIEPSRHQPGTAYVTFDLHQVNNRDPFVYKTTDYGRTWKAIASDIPRSIWSYAHCVREDPLKAGMLYLGTENGVYVSFDDGGSWLPLQNNLPHAPVHWLTVAEPAGDLVIATYGRGFWVLDDIGPLRQLADAVRAAPAHLFAPRTAWRFRPVTNTQSDANSNAEGQNAPYGIDIDYWLKEAAKEEPRIAIVDAEGKTVRTITGRNTEPSILRPPGGGGGSGAGGPGGAGADRASRVTTKEAGINRVWWDLRLEPPKEARLRTAPPAHAHVRLGTDGWRALVTWDLDIQGGQRGPLAAPGAYTVKLTVDGKEYTQPLTIRKDPLSAGTEADALEQFRMSLALRDDIDAVVAMIDQAEWLRRQLQDLAAWAREGKAGGLDKDAKELEGKVVAVEGELFDINLTGAREDAFRSPMRLYGKLAGLAANVGAASADFPPTNQQREVHALLRSQLAEARRRFDELQATELAAFNARLKDRPRISAAPPADSP
jgi:photosystem II stability/assembly factor-like uncharacterized protein